MKIYKNLIRTDRFSTTYYALLEAMMQEGRIEVNARTKEIIKVLPGGISFRIDLSTKKLPVPGVRKVYPSTSAAEVAWFLQGGTDVTWLRAHTSMWNQFVEPSDGRTVKNAYGYRWRHHFGRDQIERAIATLLDDRTSRQVLVCAWDPTADGLGEKAINFPCPTHFTLSVTGDKLHSSLFLRSSDIFVGLPYDVMGHAFLMDMLATEIGMRPGIFHITLAHAHLYVVHHDMAVTCLGIIPPTIDTIRLPGKSLTQVMKAPNEFVAGIKLAQREVRWPDYNPKPEVIQ